MVNILLVDDRPENLISLETLLKKEDEKITYLFAHSGEEALKIALKEDLALILLDVQMPDMNGFEVARYLRNISRTRDVPIIFVTAIDQDLSHMIRGFEAGAVDFLFKPLHPFITKAKVTAFVGFYEQKKELERANAHVHQLNQDLEARVEERTQELTKINNDLDNFIYTASHDLKAPINNIEGLLQVLVKRLAHDPHQQEQFQPLTSAMAQSVERFKRTIDQLTEVSKLQKQGLEQETPVDLAVVLNEVLLDLDPMVQAIHAHIHLDVQECPSIRFSPKNLRSIVYNLISNALKYHSPDRTPEVWVSCQHQEHALQFSVQDNGLGMDLTQEQKLFSMFKRLHDHVEGSGIGLYMVKKIVDNAGGNIGVESTIGQGSVFTVSLPL
ncbi:Signal transduction histidine kinase [Catalinimonas alkaloidigena]|uniref:histidine kinase n=1 Tax=Catalinimonas alkaloidigena TaxID=1075417 RepID=A0A1G9T6Y8_9BACT|nr:hybrid sensor histidine kinase/response regulator [Catalinimonas alkaloidigena]SDM43418.1 Signal transduction histidine kinase [Catalinimonas alkaloidigena]